MAGPAWQALWRTSLGNAAQPHLADQNDRTDTIVLAKALVFARTSDANLRDQVVAACAAAIGSEAGGRSLAVARNLPGYIIAADIVGLPPELDLRFRAWLIGLRDAVMSDGDSLRSLSERRPNNWGTHAGASRLAIARYLDDPAEVEAMARIFRGWLGDRRSYDRFEFRALDWQGAPDAPVGINRAGAQRDGHSVDGVLPDDQRRCCQGFTWPPPREKYVYEALQGALAQAEMLHRAGYDAWQWEDRALLRAFRWLHEVVAFPAEGDDTWQTYLINHYYGTSFPTQLPSRPGKNVGYTDWTHGPPATP